VKISHIQEGESSAEKTSTTSTLPTAPLPDPIARNIEAIVALQTKAHRDLPQHQRIVESVTTFFSRPAFLYGTILVAALWILPNVLPRRFGRQFDPPPFYALQGLVSFSALLISTGVLIKQTRQEQLAEQRAQLRACLRTQSQSRIAPIISIAR
jgi:uncharacterized membrane protein